MYTSDKSDPEYGSGIEIDNIFDNSSGDDSDGVGFNVTDYYLYDFILSEAKDVPNKVKSNVGNSANYGEIGLMPIPGQGAVNVSSTKLEWKTGTKSPSSYIIYFGTNTNPSKVGTTTSDSYDVGSLKSGTRYYWRVDQVTSVGTIQGKLWTFKAK